MVIKSVCVCVSGVERQTHGSKQRPVIEPRWPIRKGKKKIRMKKTQLCELVGKIKDFTTSVLCS